MDSTYQGIGDQVIAKAQRFRDTRRAHYKKCMEVAEMEYIANGNERFVLIGTF